MTLYNYNRAYSLIVGRPPSYESSQPDPITDEFLGVVGEGNSPPQFRTKVLNSLEFTTKDNPNPLRITASVEASKNSQGTDAVQTTITIYNLSKDSLNTVCKKNNFVLLKAGYKDQEASGTLPLIFSGQVESYETKKVNEDMVTTLTCKSGYTVSDSVRVSISLKPIPASISSDQINYQDVFDKLLSIWKSNGIGYDDSTVELEAGIPLTPSFPADIKLPNGWAYSGYLKDAMDEVCESLGYKWYVQNDLLYVHPLIYSKQKQILKLTSNLVKSVQPQSQGGRGTSTKEDVSGYLVKTNIDGRLKLADYIEVRDYKDVGATYEIVQVNHVLDYRGSVWDTDVLCEVKK